MVTSTALVACTVALGRILIGDTLHFATTGDYMNLKFDGHIFGRKPTFHKCNFMGIQWISSGDGMWVQRCRRSYLLQGVGAALGHRRLRGWTGVLGGDPTVEYDPFIKKSTCLHAIDFRALHGANLVT